MLISTDPASVNAVFPGSHDGFPGSHDGNCRHCAAESYLSLPRWGNHLAFQRAWGRILASRELRITARDGPADCLSSEGEPGWVSARPLNYADTWCVRTSVSRILGIDICVACLRFLS